VAAAALAVLAVPVMGVGTARPAASAEAREFLQVSANSEAGRSEASARDSAWWYVRTQVTDTRFPRESGTREIWQSRTEPGRLILTPPGGQPSHDAAQALLPASFSRLTWEQLFNLPTDTDDLRERVYSLAEGSGSNADSQAFVVIGDLLRESPAPPALRAALLRVIATIPDVTLESSATDSAGRAIVAVVRPSSDGLTQNRLLFDTASHRIVGEDTIVLDTFEIPGAEFPGDPSKNEPAEILQAGTTLYQSLVEEAAPVKTVGQRP
jgi:hypothetical protein